MILHWREKNHYYYPLPAEIGIFRPNDVFKQSYHRSLRTWSDRIYWLCVEFILEHFCANKRNVCLPCLFFSPFFLSHTPQKPFISRCGSLLTRPFCISKSYLDSERGCTDFFCVSLHYLKNENYGSVINVCLAIQHHNWCHWYRSKKYIYVLRWSRNLKM